MINTQEKQQFSLENLRKLNAYKSLKINSNILFKSIIKINYKSKNYFKIKQNKLKKKIILQ